MRLLVELLVKSSAILIVAAAVAALMVRSSSSSRHLIWITAFSAVLVLPVARIALPVWRVALLPSTAVQARPLQVNENASMPTPTVDMVTPATAVAVPPYGVESTRAPRIDDVVITLWLLGITVLFARRATAWMAVRRILTGAIPVTDRRMLAQLSRAASHFRVKRPIALLSHSSDGLPCTFGIRRPVILLPESFVQSNAAERKRLDAVLIHETAHVARMDALAEYISVMAVSLLWFNPLVWLASRAAQLERERAADDAVLVAGTRPTDYASDLVAIAKSHATSHWSSALPMAASALERRVSAILDDRQSRGGRSWASVFTALLLVAVVMPLSTARLVARPARQDGTLTQSVTAVAQPSVSSGDVIKPRRKVPVQQSVSAAQAPKPTEPTLINWDAERTAMLRQAFDRARKAYHDTLKRVEIGTSAAAEALPFDIVVARLEEAVRFSSTSMAPQITTLELAAIKERFAAALIKLDAAELRFKNGLATSEELANAVMATASAVNASTSAMPIAVTVLSDSALLDALKAAGAIALESARADALIDLAQRYSFTTAMVGAYVAAGNSIKSDAQRARVFAQPIRVKPGLQR